MKMETSAKLYSLNYSNVKTYLFALLFVAGNIALPQLCHLVPYGGPTLLPIYFFTLIAAYKYGFRIVFGRIADSCSFSCHQSCLVCHAIRSRSPDYTDKINLACRCFRPCCAYHENRFFISRPWSNSLLSTHRNRF